MGHPEDCVSVELPEAMRRVRERVMEWGSISKLAREIGYGREGISRALKSNGRMTFKMFWAITEKVDFHWCIRARDIKPIGEQPPESALASEATQEKK